MRKVYGIGDVVWHAVTRPGRLPGMFAPIHAQPTLPRCEGMPPEAGRMTRVVRFSTFDDLIPFAADWDRLAAGNPFRGWAWMSTWWRHYGSGTTCSGNRHLYVLAVFDRANRLVGIGPWYVDRAWIAGRVLRLLGTGEVCSEYLGILAEPDMEAEVARALAAWLVEASIAADRWGLVELTAVDEQDQSTALFVEELRRRGLMVHQRFGPRCWRIELPTTWQEYARMLSRHRRRQLRHLENRFLKSGRAVCYDASRPALLLRAQEILIDLHQRRIGSLGASGCFSSERFVAFHRDVMYPLLERGQLQLSWVELDGRPVLAEYVLCGGGVAYSYQSGFAPEHGHLSPGHIGNITVIRRAIARGMSAVDFLRGDEPYKSQWHATPRRTLEFRIAADRPSARCRLGLWLAGSRAKGWLKRRRNSIRRGAAAEPAAADPEAKPQHQDGPPADGSEPIVFPPVAAPMEHEMSTWISDP